MTSRHRREPIDLPTIVEGECDYCGADIEPPRKYCSPDCRRKYNNLSAAQGKQLVQACKHWAKNRGAAGTNGAGMLTLIRNRTDDFLREDRARKLTLKDSRDGH